tara:strand:- start:422 stop:583 length:162 start_codon:yes stop_codon:yes gene_type:complete
MSQKNKTWIRIQEHRKALEKSPNGWPLSVMVGSEYLVHSTYRKAQERKEMKNA